MGGRVKDAEVKAESRKTATKQKAPMGPNAAAVSVATVRAVQSSVQCAVETSVGCDCASSCTASSQDGSMLTWYSGPTRCW